MADPPDVLAEEQVLELSLHPLVDVQALVVEDPDVHRAGVQRRVLDVQGGGRPGVAREVAGVGDGQR